MAAITKRLLYLRPTIHSYARPNPCSQRFFSSSSDGGDDAPEFEQPPQTPSSFASTLGAVRDNLLTQSPPQPDLRQPFSGKSSFPPTPPPPRGRSTDDIRHMLSGFQSRYAPPPPTGDGAVSMQDLYERNQKPRGESSATSGLGTRPLDSIRGRLSKLVPSGTANRRRQTPGSTPISSITENLMKKAHTTYLQKDIMGRGWNPDPAELGKKLKMMRPEKRKGKWFSLQELSDRLAKLKEAGHEESAKGLGKTYQEIVGSIEKIGLDNDQNARSKSQRMMTLGVLGSAGAALAEKTGSPKSHLVEKYFHPDNMSSAEKMKLELAKVRDEFKMSESDCGSARVQVATLTTKIKHLSTALHKKDKHSRKGLQAMVQQRKKLLKYLRRTDWDSYCLVLAKLGLRDNADIKA